MTNMSVSNYNDSFKVVSFDDHHGKKAYTIVDRFGNILVPFMDGEISLFQISNNRCFVFGESNGIKNLYFFYTSTDKVDESFSKRVDIGPNILLARLINSERLLLLTDFGLCFFDTTSLEQKSDFYDSLYPYEKNKKDCWIYEKIISGDKYSTTITGLIDLDGHVNEECYDTFFRKNREIYKNLHSSSYDTVSTDEILSELKQKELDDNTRKVNKIKRLARKNV